MVKEDIIIEVYSHFFICKVFSERARSVCNVFARRFVLTRLVPIWNKFGKRRFIEQNEKIFATANKSRTEYRFLVNGLEEFKKLLFFSGFTDNDVSYFTIDNFESDSVTFKVKEKWKPKEHQLAFIDFLLNKSISHKLLDLPTGEGKTFCALYAISILAKRTILILKPKYLKKWVSDIKEQYEIEDSDLYLVDSTSSLIYLMEEFKNNNLKPSFIIISNRILLNWFNIYKEQGNDQYNYGYLCKPDELFLFFKAGIRLIDEAHEDLHINGLIDLHTHVEDTISLSATMINKNELITKIQNMLYPFKSRYGKFLPKKYTDCFAVNYTFKMPYKIKCMSSMGYSHTAFEKSLLTKNNINEYKGYIKLILEQVKEYFIPITRPNKKLIVFVATIEFVRRLERIIHKAYPEFKVKGYCEKDPREYLLESDIVITTILKTGTGEDVPNLTTVIMTNSVDSIQTNIQTLGRLRKLNDHKTEFIYLYCSNITKQLEYHENKKIYFNSRVKSFKEILSGFCL